MDRNLRILDLKSDPAAWDAGIEESDNGTLFHKSVFLDYHGDRFRDSDEFRGIALGDACWRGFLMRDAWTPIWECNSCPRSGQVSAALY